VGDLELQFDCNRIVLLNDILYVLEFKQNFVSFAKLINHGYSVSFHSGITISRDGNVLYNGHMYGNLFFINHINNQINNAQSKPITNKKRKANINYSYLWHFKLGHINPSMI
jgi:hypothetical protein